MGTSTVGASTAPINSFYSQNTWIEGSAVNQLNLVAKMAGVNAIAAFPDLHPGKYGPVGCAVLADRIYPQLIGNDIGCGMSLFALDIAARNIRIDKASEKLQSLQGKWNGAAATVLKAHGIAADCFPESLGTIGGGNHFCELQTVAEVVDTEVATHIELKAGQAMLLVHSGSRALGNSVFANMHGSFESGLASGSPAASAYMVQHDNAIKWSSLNRQIIAQRAANALRCNARLITDCPHNLVTQFNGSFLHRKGAARADSSLVPLAGSRGTLSYLLTPVNKTVSSLESLAHGAGRKYDRASMQGRAGTTKSDREKLARNPFGGQIVCHDRQLLIEEAPAAYKNIKQVLADLTESGLARAVLSLKPLITFKKAVVKRDTTNKDKYKRQMRQRRAR